MCHIFGYASHQRPTARGGERRVLGYDTPDPALAGAFVWRGAGWLAGGAGARAGGGGGGAAGASSTPIPPRAGQ